MKAIFAAGGTGGHIQPAIALACELREEDSNSEVLFVGGNREQERKWIVEAGFPFQSVSSSPLSGSLLKRTLVPARMGLGVFESLELMLDFRPDVVLGFGGYTSFPPMIAGLLMRKPRLLLEQNVLPGKTNRLLARVATEVHSQWEEARRYFGSGVPFRHSGNPVRKKVLEGLESANGDRKALLVIGGSQGSEPINELMMAAAPSLAHLLPDLEVIHLAGEGKGEEVKHSYENAGLRFEVHDYLDDMAHAYGRCGLAVSRAGGTTIAELMAAKIPAILIPYPLAAENHQFKNARAVESHGAGLCLSESEISPESLAQHITDLLGNPGILKTLSAQTRALAVPEASRKILHRIRELIERS